MPTYTYQCTDCKAAFEQFQKFSEDPLTECPSCSGMVKRVIHPVGIVFKGAGWYVTDSRTGTTDATVPAAPAKSASETPAPAAESKPAAVETKAPAPEAKAAV